MKYGSSSLVVTINTVNVVLLVQHKMKYSSSSLSRSYLTFHAALGKQLARAFFLFLLLLALHISYVHRHVQH